MVWILLHYTKHVMEISDLNNALKHIVKVKVTLRLTVSQPVSLGAEPHLGIMTR
jgi:hypothetical protein